MKRLALLGLLATAACNPYVYQQSVAPPGRSARLDEVTGFWGNLQRYRLEVSEGVALALTCNRGGPCEKLSVVSANPAIAEVRPASLSALQVVGYGMAAQQQPASAFVVVGRAPGTTRIRLTAKEGKRDIDVTVIAPPERAPSGRVLSSVRRVLPNPIAKGPRSPRRQDYFLGGIGTRAFE